MKQRLKGLLALVLSLVMVFALATNAWAAVRIGGVEMGDGTTTTYYYNGTNGAQGSTSDTDTGNWNAKVERINGVQTLTLNNFTMVDNSHYEAISSDQDLTLNLIGDNEITASYPGSGVVVVAVSVTGKLAIEGTGSLTADGTYRGLSASSGVDISGGKVEATGRDSGINANNITITGGTVTATGDEDYGYGIYALEYNFNGGDITISNGTVTATGGTAGMYADNKATIEGGTVTATGGSAGAGIGADNAITISGADTNVTVGCETGLYAGTVNIAGGIVTINSTEDAISNSATLNLGTGSRWYEWTDDKNATTMNDSDFALSAYNGNPPAYLRFAPIGTGVEDSPSGQGPGAQQPSYNYPVYIPTVEDEPEKVEAAPTFDGGIASAVVVTILSATGGAWLAKKKD